MMKRILSRGYLLLLLALLYAPIIVIAVFSFTEAKVMGNWTGFSTGIYERLFSGKSVMIMKSVENTLLIALIAAAVAKYAGARRVIITDVNDYRLELARKMGVDAAVNTAREDLPRIMKGQGLVEGFDVGLEMSGNGAALQQMIGAMRNGGKISLLGISNRPVPMDMNTIITKGLTLQGIYGRHLDNWHQMSYMVQGGLDVSPVITHRFHYTEFEKGFEAMNSGRSGKVVLDWTVR